MKLGIMTAEERNHVFGHASSDVFAKYLSTHHGSNLQAIYHGQANDNTQLQQLRSIGIDRDERAPKCLPPSKSAELAQDEKRLELERQVGKLKELKAGALDHAEFQDLSKELLNVQKEATRYARRARHAALKEHRKRWFQTISRDDIEAQLDSGAASTSDILKLPENNPELSENNPELSSVLGHEWMAVVQAFYENAVSDKRKSLISAIKATASLCLLHDSSNAIDNRPVVVSREKKLKCEAMMDSDARLYFKQITRARACPWDKCGAFLHFEASSWGSRYEPMHFTIPDCVRHLRRHTARTKQCRFGLCRESFPSQAHFQDHVLKEHMLRNEHAPFPAKTCGLCTKLTTRESLWIDHCNSHRDSLPKIIGPKACDGVFCGTPGVCPFCVKKGTTGEIKFWWCLSSFRSHIVVHLQSASRAERFECPHPLCSEEPESISNLLSHLLEHGISLPRADRAQVLAESKRAVTTDST